MENRQNQPLDITYRQALQIKEAQLAVREVEIITYLSEFGRQPSTNIPLLDAFIDVGCPCRQCFRDEFLS